jgi:excisionase family DNA binding protein
MPKENQAKPRLLTEAEAAEYLSVSHSTIIRWRKQRKGPAVTRLAGIVRYSVDELDAFIERNTENEGREK